jgi:hypothetical protein
VLDCVTSPLTEQWRCELVSPLCALLLYTSTLRTPSTAVTVSAAATITTSTSTTSNDDTTTPATATAAAVTTTSTWHHMTRPHLQSPTPPPSSPPPPPRHRMMTPPYLPPPPRIAGTLISGESGAGKTETAKYVQTHVARARLNKPQCSTLVATVGYRWPSMNTMGLLSLLRPTPGHPWAHSTIVGQPWPLINLSWVIRAQPPQKSNFLTSSTFPPG